MKKNLIAAAVALLLFSAAPAMAQLPKEGVYFGSDFGITTLRGLCDTLGAHAMAQNDQNPRDRAAQRARAEALTKCDHQGNLWRLYSGFRVTDHFSLEAGYATLLGDMQSTGKREGYPVLGLGDVLADARYTYETEYSFWNVNLVGEVPINKFPAPRDFVMVHDMILYGHFGVAAWKIDTLVTSDVDPNSKISNNGTNVSYGTGLKVVATDNIHLKLEWSRVLASDTPGTYQVDAEIDSIIFGALFNF